MMTQSVMSQAVNLFGSAAGSVTYKGKKTTSGFDLMIDSLKAQNSFGNTGAAAAKKAAAQKLTADSTKQSDETGDAAKQVPAQRTKASDPLKDTVDLSQPQDAITEENAPKATDTDPQDVPKVDDQLLEQIIAMLQAVSEAVMNKLNLSPDEFKQLMTEQNLNSADLLEPENLQKLILADSKETGISAVLTNENLADTMKDLLKQVEDIKTAAGLPIPLDQIKAILVQAKASDALQMLKTDLLQLPGISEQKTTAEKDPNDGVKANTAGNSDQAGLQSFSDKGNKPEIKASVNQEPGKDIFKNEGLSSNSSQEASDRGDKADLKTPDQFQMFLDNLVKAAKDTQTDSFNKMAGVSELREIANQIIEKIKISVTPDQTSMELKLNPESLGKVNLTVQSKNGNLTAQFVVQNEVSKEAIESQLSTLRETLNHQGIKVEAIEVTISANIFEQNNGDASRNQEEQQKGNTGRQITLEEAVNMTEELPEEDNLERNISSDLGSRIDYTA